MQWPWQKRADENPWWATIERKLQVIEEKIQAGQDRMVEPLEILEQIPRMQRQITKASAILVNWDEKREAEREEAARLRASFDMTIKHLMDWVDELSVIGQKTSLDDPWYEVHRAWLRQAESVLDDLGYVAIPVLGRIFDATVAEAVGTVDDTGQAPPYTVMEVVRRGYRLKGQLWRRAEVITVRPADMSEEER